MANYCVQPGSAQDSTLHLAWFHVAKAPQPRWASFYKTFSLIFEKILIWHEFLWCSATRSKNLFWVCPGRYVGTVLRASEKRRKEQFLTSELASNGVFFEFFSKVWSNPKSCVGFVHETRFYYLTCNCSFIWCCMELSCRFSFQNAIKTWLEQLSISPSVLSFENKWVFLSH